MWNLSGYLILVQKKMKIFPDSSKQSMCPFFPQVRERIKKKTKEQEGEEW